MGTEMELVTSRRCWVSPRGNWLHPGWPHKRAPLVFRGGDEGTGRRGNRPRGVEAGRMKHFSFRYGDGQVLGGG
jgi:hypothetical protein